MRTRIFGVFLLVSTAQVLSLEVPDQYFTEHSLKCIAKLNVDKQIVGKHFDDSLHLPKGIKEMNNALECVAAESGIIKDDTLNIDLLKIHVRNTLIPLLGKGGSNSDELTEKAVRECKLDAKDCDRIVAIHNCIIDVITECE
ncbi:hypothetical protein RI129_009699 [Pyrocoelia pectoralis]|uniref:Uncharacterized protein n=1 Tax=Pyrocoelia pectoralis TaxID=417401 RepID=A0AAN7ZG27_9COLE